MIKDELGGEITNIKIRDQFKKGTEKFTSIL